MKLQKIMDVCLFQNSVCSRIWMQTVTDMPTELRDIYDEEPGGSDLLSLEG